MIDPNDTTFQDKVVTNVSPEHGKDGALSGWAMTSDDGWTFYVPAEHGVEPHVGDSVRFYGRGIGYRARGLSIDGRVVFYRTEVEEQDKNDRDIEANNQKRRADFEAVRSDHDRRIAALPEVFRRRLKKFQDASPDFRWKHEGYELMCCEQAVLFAATLKTIEAIGAFHDADWEVAKAQVPGLEDGHSGNSFDFACRLARSYLADPELVYHDHGALAILVGCKDYVCPHPEPVS